VFDVSYNLGLHGSLPNFPHEGSLNNLNLSHTNFSGPIPESIHNLRQLSTLDLSNCQFNETLPNSMSHLTQLVHLDLSFNNFTGPLPSLNRS
jgi:Leucine-rich repeat (LRR) protein